MTEEPTVYIAEPLGMCEHCVNNPKGTHEDFVIVWCEHTRYGGIYQIPIGQWSIVGPFGNEGEFQRSVSAAFARKLMAKSH